MITDQEILNNTSGGTTAPRFTLRAVLQQLAAQAGAGQTPEQMYRQWWDVFNATPGLTNQPGVPHCSDQGGTLNGFPYSCRTAEGSQAATTTPVTVDSYVPIGLVNRFDLAPTDGANCGEYRILFAKDGATATDRSLTIFEASLPNPNPALGIEGCLPVQTFWADLVTDNVAASRAVKLRNFYFNGLAGLPTTKVISIDNFGKSGGEGQVRVNIFRQGPWHLREFKLQTLPSCTTAPCNLTFVPVTDKVNPAPVLFGPATGPQATLIQEFQNDFLAQVPSLALNDINRFTFNMADRYNIGQSNSQFDNYGRSPSPVATQAFKNAIAAAIPAGANLTADNILSRATTQSCAGCHNTSNNAAIGQGMAWPPAVDFVHVSERLTQPGPDGTRFVISPALQTTFLPHRLDVMRDYLATFTPALTVGLDATKVLLNRGVTKNVHVTVSRNRVGSVTVAVVNPPAGLSANTLTLPEGVNEGDLTLTVPQSQASGLLGTLTIRATGGALVSDASLVTVVQGTPGEKDTSFGVAGIFAVSKLSTGRFLEMKLNGDLLVGGVDKNSSQVGIAAVGKDGVVDSTYGTSGVAVPSMGFAFREAGALGMTGDGVGSVGFLVLEEIETRGTGDVWLGVLNASGVFPPNFVHTSGSTIKKGRRIALNQNGQEPCGVTHDFNEYRVATKDLTLNSLQIMMVQDNGELDGGPSTVLSGFPVTYCGSPVKVPEWTIPYSLGNGLGLASVSRPRVERGIGTVSGRPSQDSQRRVTVATSFDRAGVRVASFLRLMPDGTLDHVSDIPAQGFVGEARMAYSYDDGRVLVAGYATVGTVRKAALARFNAAGQLDTTFGNAGVVLLREDITTNTEAQEVVVQPEGDIVVLGSASTGPFLVRLWR